MSTASTRIWTFATVILVIAVVALGWFLGASPKLAEIARVNSERLAVAAQNELARVALTQLQEDFERLDEFQRQLDELQAAFPEYPEYAATLDALFSDLTRSGLALESLSIGEPSPTDPSVVLDQFGQVPAGTLLELGATTSVRGELDAVLDFIDELQNSERYVTVPTFQFSGGRNAETQSASITITFYVIAGQPASGAIPLDGTAGETPSEEVPTGNGEEPTGGDS